MGYDCIAYHVGHGSQTEELIFPMKIKKTHKTTYAAKIFGKDRELTTYKGKLKGGKSIKGGGIKMDRNTNG